MILTKRYKMLNKLAQLLSKNLIAPTIQESRFAAIHLEMGFASCKVDQKLKRPHNGNNGLSTSLPACSASAISVGSLESKLLASTNILHPIQIPYEVYNAIKSLGVV
jgi:hypothetical protein